MKVQIMPRETPGYPEYKGSTDDIKTLNYFEQLGGRRAFSGLIDKAYFVFAGLASIWLAVAALVVATTSFWWAILLILVVWAMFAYLTLPRFHKMMTTLYVPNYFIGRTQTADGLLGDPVNLAIRGESDDIHQAFKKAGWVKADPVNLVTSWKIIVSTLTKRSYPSAPVSPLYLFDRKEDFAYQQDVENSTEKRHHIRFWKTPEGWKLPGGEEVDWVAAATFDRAVGLSLFTFQVTHKIDAETDNERDYVIDTVMFCNDEVEKEVIEDFSAGYHSRNGGGDAIITDGDLPILEMNSVADDMEVSDNSPESQYSHHRRPFELIEDAPISIWVASFFVSLVAVIQAFITFSALDGNQLSQTANRLVDSTPLLNWVNRDWLQHTDWIIMSLLLVLALVQMGLAIGVIRGFMKARKVILALLVVSFVSTAIRVLTDDVTGGAMYQVFVLMASQVFAMIEFTSDDAVNYTYNKSTTPAQRQKDGQDGAAAVSA